MRSFQSLSEQEILALAISLEEEDARIYGDFAEGLKADYPSTAAMLQQMQLFRAWLIAETAFIDPGPERKAASDTSLF